jgi:hypothetical protein
MRSVCESTGFFLCPRKERKKRKQEGKEEQIEEMEQFPIFLSSQFSIKHQQSAIDYNLFSLYQNKHNCE